MFVLKFVTLKITFEGVVFQSVVLLGKSIVSFFFFFFSLYKVIVNNDFQLTKIVNGTAMACFFYFLF